jgi:cytochrome oxidase assembly protein ShyY1
VPILLTARAWAAHLLMVLALAVAIAGGLWQYHDWSASRSNAQRDLVDAAPVPLASAMGGDSPVPGGSLGRPVTLEGSWLPSSTVYVSGRYLHHELGFWVVTPVRIGQSAMPVVRGWSARPSAPAADGPVTLTGWLQASEGQGEADTDPHDDVINSMRIASLTQHVDMDLYSGYVVARTDTAVPWQVGLDKLTPGSIPPVSSTTALRNLLYAIQWWFFGGFAIYVWIRWCRDQLEEKA